MPIKPIDLQTLFMQLDQVGRARSAEKDGAILQQSIQAGIQQKKQLEKAEAVKELDHPGQDEGSEKVRERDEEGAEAQSGGSDRKGQRPEKDDASPGPDVVRDPDLGNTIDISG
jgi:hypothetical protein